MTDFKGKIIVVIGASRCLGKVLVETFRSREDQIRFFAC